LFLLHFCQASDWRHNSLAPAKPLPQAFWQQNRHCQLKKQPFFANNFKIQGGARPPPLRRPCVQEKEQLQLTIFMKLTVDDMMNSQKKNASFVCET